MTGTPQDLYSVGLVLSVTGTQRNLGTGKICCLYFTVCASVLVLSPAFEQDCRTFGAWHARVRKCLWLINVDNL